MSNEIISIKNFREFDAGLSLEESLKEDIETNILPSEIAKSISLSEAEDVVEYNLSFKKIGNNYIAVMPESALERHQKTHRMEDYLVVDDKRAMEIL